VFQPLSTLTNLADETAVAELVPDAVLIEKVHNVSELLLGSWR